MHYSLLQVFTQLELLSNKNLYLRNTIEEESLWQRLSPRWEKCLRGRRGLRVTLGWRRLISTFDKTKSVGVLPVCSIPDMMEVPAWPQTYFILIIFISDVGAKKNHFSCGVGGFNSAFCLWNLPHDVGTLFTQYLFPSIPGITTL